ncbi:MAG TPA: hypothetical protein IAA41_05990 [Candidatus Eubacterium faecavium]|nr:hypothetical protein [Candidatus Eubacterium faecavium]
MIYVLYLSTFRPVLSGETISNTACGELSVSRRKSYMVFSADRAIIRGRL